MQTGDEPKILGQADHACTAGEHPPLLILSQPFSFSLVPDTASLLMELALLWDRATEV